MDYLGTVRNGVVVLENGNQLPEGTQVRVSLLGPETPAGTLGERLLRFAGTAQNLPSDLAEQHDHYLHGQPKQ